MSESANQHERRKSDRSINIQYTYVNNAVECHRCGYSNRMWVTFPDNDPLVDAKKIMDDLGIMAITNEQSLYPDGPSAEVQIRYNFTPKKMGFYCSRCREGIRHSVHYPTNLWEAIKEATHYLEGQETHYSWCELLRKLKEDLCIKNGK